VYDSQFLAAFGGDSRAGVSSVDVSLERKKPVLQSAASRLRFHDNARRLTGKLPWKLAVHHPRSRKLKRTAQHQMGITKPPIKRSA
jgi:hypothetical protein